MDLSWQTRLLLWLLNKRPDINIRLHFQDTTQTDLSQALEEFNYDELCSDDELSFDRYYLEECYEIPSEHLDGAES